MNPAILQVYIGPDIKGHQVAGIIRHATYTKGCGNTPTGYVVQCYPNEGALGGCAIVPAELVKRHVSGLELVASIEGDKG